MTIHKADVGAVRCHEGTTGCYDMKEQLSVMRYLIPKIHHSVGKDSQAEQ
jgi:hypothetical protein